MCRVAPQFGFKFERFFITLFVTVFFVFNSVTAESQSMGVGSVLEPVAKSVTLKSIKIEEGSDESSGNFVEPKLKERASAVYPTTEALKFNAGMVELLFMVDKNGSTYEPVVVRSTDIDFEKSAKGAIKKYKYSPAKEDGQPIEGVTSSRILFYVEDVKGKVSKEFSLLYRSAHNELNRESPRKNRVLRKIKRMEEQEYLSPYALGRLNLLKYRSAVTFGETLEKALAIEQMLLFEKETEDAKRILDIDLTIKAYGELFRLYVSSKQYGEALRAYDRLIDIDPGAKSVYREALIKLEELSKNDTPVSNDVVIGGRGYATLYLFKKTFSFSNLKGSIKTLKLRCDRKFAAPKFIPNSEYQIPDSWGKCHLQVLGKPGSTAIVWQY